MRVVRVVRIVRAKREAEVNARGWCPIPPAGVARGVSAWRIDIRGWFEPLPHHSFVEFDPGPLPRTGPLWHPSALAVLVGGTET